MKNKFAIGVVAGISSLALAIPILAQFANAASSSSSMATQPQATQGDTLVTTDQQKQQVDLKLGGHIGANGAREELLTGDNAAKATAAALVAVPGGTIDRVETDTEGDTYEAHMTKADGSRVTVKFDANFNVTRIEDGPSGHMGR